MVGAWASYPVAAVSTALAARQLCERLESGFSSCDYSHFTLSASKVLQKDCIRRPLCTGGDPAARTSLRSFACLSLAEVCEKVDIFIFLDHIVNVFLSLIFFLFVPLSVGSVCAHVCV